MKQIILLRHSEVEIDFNKSMTSNEFGRWVADYNHSNIKPAHKLENELKYLFDSHAIVLTSQLKRTKDTAKLFTKKIFLEDSIFNEFEIPYLKCRGLKLKPKVWLIIYRLLWFLGFSKNSESYQISKKRVKLCVDKLNDLSKEHDKIIVVGSGLINKFIYSALLCDNWSSSKKGTHNYLDYTIIQKNV